ncbi:cyclic lactone autoinducer peptide [Pseudoflavonifractor capillosus]|nr:cyclic lactone autoinducer peptide [Pseudoflavonifractor capillosus]
MNLVTKSARVIAALAFMLATWNANSTCIFWSYQPDLPEELIEKDDM